MNILPVAMLGLLGVGLAWGMVAAFFYPTLMSQTLPPASSTNLFQTHTSPLIAYWPMDQVRSQMTPDQSSNGFHGVLLNFPSAPSPLVTGMFSNALAFTSQSTLSVLPGGRFDLSKGFTFRTWFKSQGAQTSRETSLADWTGMLANSWKLGIGADGMAQAIFTMPDGKVQTLASDPQKTSSLLDGHWHHLGLSLDVQSGQAKVGVDGQIAAQGTLTNWTSSLSAFFYMGAIPGTPNAGSFLLDETMILNQAETPSPLNPLSDPPSNADCVTNYPPIFVSAGPFPGATIQADVVTFSGIIVGPSDKVNITANGLAAGSPGPPSLGPNGLGYSADGNYGMPNIVGPPANVYGLIGALRDTNQPPESVITQDQWFWVGPSLTNFVPSKTGELVFLFNDALYQPYPHWLEAYADNSGGFTAYCSVSKICPALTNMWEKDSRCNDLTTQNTKGTTVNRLFASVEADDKAELRIKTTVTSGGGKFVWGVLDGGNLLPETGRLEDGGEADVIFTPTGNHKVYTVRIGNDTDSDGQLQQSEIIQSPKPPANPYTVLVVTQADYGASRIVLIGGSIIVNFQSTARMLLNTFLNGRQPVGSNISDTTLSASNPALHHVAGAIFTPPACTAAIKLYTFLVGSRVSNEVKRSKILSDLECAFVATKKQEVTNFFASQNVPDHTFTWPWEATFDFGDKGLENPIDEDLHFAFGHVTFIGTVKARIKRSNLRIETVQTTGGFTDIYDFNYEADGGRLSTLLNGAGASVQLGWMSRPGNVAGKIFESRVDIDSHFNNWPDALRSP